MNIGLPKEIKTDEYRVALVPGAVETIASAGHKVFMEKGAGLGAGLPDREYENAGAVMCRGADEVWRRSEMIVKVKEPLRPEIARMREGQVIFAYLHLAAAKTLARALIRKRVRAVAFETVRLADGDLPLLKPMSEIAGRMSVQEGAKYLERTRGGRGILLSGVPGVRRGTVVILGGGTVGKNAARIANGLHANTLVLDVNRSRLEYLEDVFDGRVRTFTSTPETIRQLVKEADLLIGAVLNPGAQAPVLVSRSLVREMLPGAVIVDVAVDQGGCVETIRPTHHSKPTYMVDGVVHYGVANMPGAVPRTSTFALSNVIHSYALELANRGVADAVRSLSELAGGLNVAEGRVTNSAVAEAIGAKYTPPEQVF